MNKITLKTLNVNLIACYGKMKLDVTICQTRKTKKNSGINIRIEDYSDRFHVNPNLEWCGKDKFKYHVGCCFGGQSPDMPEFNDKLRALAKDPDFVKWFKENILHVAERLTKF